MGKASLRVSNDDVFPLMNKVEEFLASDRQVMLILGDSGAGKSTFSRHLEHHLWTNYKNGDPVPLFVNLPTIHKPQDDMIWKQLDIHGFSNDQILEMKQRQQLILICDGYDESRLSVNLYQSNRLNQSNQWRTKMIISCRSQFLGSVYIDRFAPQTMDRYAKVQQDLFQEVVIAPFSNKQVEDYVARYVPLEPRPWVTEDYMRMLTTIPNLMDLVKNPFILTLALEALPGVTKGQQELSNISISHVQLYDHFVNEWLGVNMRRLRDNSLTDDEREMLEHMMEKGFIFLGIDYSKRLALAIFEKNDGNPVVQYVHFDHKTTWRAAFFGPEPEARLLREASPLTRTGSLFRFIHRSMLEYFFSRTVFDPIILGDGDEFAPQLNLGSSDLRPIDRNGPFFTRNLIREPSVIHFLCERVKENVLFEKQLRAVVELSKTDSRAATAAANAMTILVQAEVLFHDTDLQGVRIPGADVSGGQFDHARFQGADLKGVNFAGSWLRKADISYAQLRGVRFGKSQYLDQGSEVGACAFSPDGRILALSLRDRSSIKVYDTATWTRIYSICLFEKELSRASETNLFPMSMDSIAFSPDSRHFVTANSDPVLRLWDCVNGKAVLVMKGHKAGVHSVAFSPGGKHIASSSRDKTVRHWSAETGETISVMKGHTGAVRSVDYSPDGRTLVSGSDDGTIRFWSPQTGEAIAVWVGSQGPVLCLSFASDGQRLACGYKNGDAQVWDTLVEDAGRILSGHMYSDVTGIAFSPNGRWVATSGADYAVRLWDAMTGDLVSTFSEHTDKVWDVAFSPDGRQLASGGEDGFVRLWDVNTSEPSAGQQDSNKTNLSAVFLADGCFILSNQGKGSVRLWNPLTGAVSRDLAKWCSDCEW
ncbi:hypothetical protein BGZ97_001340 [Linnemannia gamsii]|uniref:Intraflagellar transport protein 122 homolog n=1 Tax=Linnemannia gamsii TaxID=64522 RepID=A0A9P6QZ23_9FUNG|nr:hypothetical protein BGZ97_001340 [Linnemannia gamsii]